MSLPALCLQGARHSKMEKADILEMAVKHLRHIQRQQYSGSGGGADLSLSDKYRLGFNQCAQEVSRYLGAAHDDDPDLRARLLNHLANCITSSDSSPLSPSPLSTPSTSPAPSGHVASPGSGGVTPVTPVTPIPMRPLSKPAGSVFSLLPQPGLGGSPPSAAAAVIVPTTEINNNIATVANNNHIVVGGGSGGGGELASVGSQVTLSTAASSLAPAGGGKVVGEVQVVGQKAGGGGGEGVALVLPANVMAGGPLHSYIIPLYTSPPNPHTSLSLTPNATSNAVTTNTAAVHLPLSVMTAPPQQLSAQANVNASAGVVTLAPGAALSPTVLPPSSVGHVVAAGLAAWQPAAPLYPASSLSPSSSSTSSVHPSPSAPSLSLPSTSGTKSSENVTAATNLSVGSSSLGKPTPLVFPGHPAAVLAPAPPTTSQGGASPSSLLHPQPVRPQPLGGALEGPGAGEGPVWRPW